MSSSINYRWKLDDGTEMAKQRYVSSESFARIYFTWVRRIRFLNSWRKPTRSTKLVCLRSNDKSFFDTLTYLTLIIKDFPIMVSGRRWTHTSTWSVQNRDSRKCLTLVVYSDDSGNPFNSEQFIGITKFRRKSPRFRVLQSQ